MNDITLNELKVIVERAVRPVRASTARKRNMRLELLAHVIAVFEEEVKLSDERTALGQSEQRFGNPKELTERLQQSVPASDGFQRLLDKLWFRPGEPTGRLVRRYLACYSLILMLLLPSWYVWVQVCAWLVRVSKWPVDEPRLLFGGPVLLLDVIFFAFASVLLVWGLKRLEREMTARFRSHHDWASLHVEKEGGAPA